VIVALFAAALVGMMIIPLPASILDILLASNIALSVLILVVNLFAPEALSVSSFPSLLLLTTLFRLGLNVSTTRLVLTKGDAGEVVAAFGKFVLQGDLVVGLVIFLIITLVQFLVIGKGAERVAEVSARFTLDAMPGKQMSIDAALRNGALTEQEAQQKRDDLGRESQLHGAMDGAMKFVKGDAIAGLVITALNLCAGFVIGVLRRKMTLAAAAETYSVLTVGDGLCAQIPALLITLSAGILTTRVAPREKNQTLGHSLRSELLSNPKVLGIGAGLCSIVALVPGLPTMPFLVIACGLGGLAAKTLRAKAGTESATAQGRALAFKRKLEDKVKEAKAQRSVGDNVVPSVVPISIELEAELARSLGFDNPSACEDTELVGVLMPQLRDALYLETGVRFPGVRVLSGAPGLAVGQCQIRIKDVPVSRETIPIDKLLAVASPAQLKRLGVDAVPGKHPLSGAEVSLVGLEHKDLLEASGIAVWTASGVIALALARVLRRRARDFLGLQEASDLMDRLDKAYPALVKEVVPKAITLPQLVDVLRRLVDEGVSIRDLKTIVEALGEAGPYENDGVALTEMVRAALSRQIAHAHAGLTGRLPVVLLDPMIEDAVRGGIRSTRGGACLALEPEINRAIVRSTLQTLRPVVQAGLRPVILTSAEVRRFVRKLLETDLPEVSVLSFEELPGELTIQPMGRVVVRDERPALAA
jgi:type III secretion protein V